MSESRRGDPKPISGLDMAPTISWYTTNKDKLSKLLPPSVEEPSPFPTMDGDYFSITDGEIASLVALFPERAILRSRLNTGSVIGKPTLYFAKGATPDDIKTTGAEEEALSPTAIIPSYTDNERWQNTGRLSSDVWLFHIPEGVDPVVRRIIHAQGFVHELAHTIATQALYSEGYGLEFLDGRVRRAYDYLIEFANAAEKYAPISHYSSFYRKKGEELKSLVAIEEELVETIAALLLGFAFSPDKSKRLDPLADRPDVRRFIVDFLHAKAITLPVESSS